MAFQIFQSSLHIFQKAAHLHLAKPCLFTFSKKSQWYTFLLLGVASKSSIFCSSSSHENFQGFLSPLSIDKSPSLSIWTYRAIFHMLSKTNMAVFTIPYLSTTESIGDVNFAHRYRCEIGSKVPRPFNVSLLLAVARDYYYIRLQFFFFFLMGFFRF